MTYDVGNPGLCLGQAQTCGRVKLVNWIPNLSISNDNTIYKKPLQIYSHSKRTHTMTKLNDKINMDNTTAGSMNAYS